MAPRKFTEEQEKEIASKYEAGTSITKLVQEYDTTYTTLNKVLARCDAHSPAVKQSKCNFKEFEKRAASVLWRQQTGREEDRKEYHTWKARITELESPNGSNYTHQQAVVQASKNFPCLGRLMREYDLRPFDPNPDSHPNVKQFGDASGNKVSVFCEDKKLSYRECLQWALNCAGEYQRTGQEPTQCPCNSAWYLYQQAIADPKDFLSKLGQVEAKTTGESQESKDARKSAKRSLSELNAMLDELTPKEESENAELDTVQ
jgi:hypothetical protein